MNKLKTLSVLAKILGLSVAFDFTALSPAYGVLIVLAASTAKDIVLKIGDWLDDKTINQSFQG